MQGARAETMALDGLGGFAFRFDPPARLVRS
jgi:hypothetical protein